MFCNIERKKNDNVAHEKMFKDTFLTLNEKSMSEIFEQFEQFYFQGSQLILRNFLKKNKRRIRFISNQ